MKALGYPFLAIFAIGIIVLRVQGCHMTEGEQLVAFWPRYLAGFFMAFVGLVLVTAKEK